VHEVSLWTCGPKMHLSSPLEEAEKNPEKTDCQTGSVPTTLRYTHTHHVTIGN